MLGDYPVYATIPSTDIEKVRSFYSDTLGLKLVMEMPDGEGLLYESGGSMMYIYRTRVGVGSGSTLASWDVKGLDAVIDDLRSRGVRLEEYDLPGLKTENGIADLGGYRGAWFKDPEANVLSVFEGPDIR